MCSLVIYSGSCANKASTAMVGKLALPLLEYTQQYNLQCVNPGANMQVTHKVVIPFKIGKYKDAVLCDVASMEAYHLLFGGP